MALYTHISDTVDPTRHLFNIDDSAEQPMRLAGVYRCQCCGEEIAHDALAACCRCSEECYEGAGAEPMH